MLSESMAHDLAFAIAVFHLSTWIPCVPGLDVLYCPRLANRIGCHLKRRCIRLLIAWVAVFVVSDGIFVSCPVSILSQAIYRLHYSSQTMSPSLFTRPIPGHPQLWWTHLSPLTLVTLTTLDLTSAIICLVVSTVWPIITSRRHPVKGGGAE